MISVLIPAFNAAPYIEYAISSVLDQDIDIPLEIVVCDDGSTDGTADILKKLAQDEPRLRVLSTENGGVSRARNRLIEEANPESDFITFLDADDALPQGRIARDLALFAKTPALEVIYGQLCLIETDQLELRAIRTRGDICVRGISVTVGTFRRGLIAGAGGFDTSFSHGEDLDYLLRLFEKSPKALLLDEVSVLYRQHHGSATSQREKLRRGVMRAMLLHNRRLRADPNLVRLNNLFDLEALPKKRANKRKIDGLSDYSVIIPAFNAAPFLPDTIRSVLQQTHPPKEIIVVDDGSTDDTLQVLDGIPAELKVIHQENRGPGAATNAGIAVASSDFLAFLDADDLWEPEKMEKQLHVLMDQQDLGGVFCRMSSFNHDGAALAVDDGLSGWARSTMVLRRETIDDVGPISDFGRKVGEMIDWIARAQEKQVRFQLLEVSLARRRLHSDSMTASRNDTQREYLHAIKEAIRRKRERKKLSE